MNPVHVRLLEALTTLGCQPTGESSFVVGRVRLHARSTPSGHRSFLETDVDVALTAQSCVEALMHNAVACPLVLGPNGFVRRVTLQPEQWLHEPRKLAGALELLAGGRSDADAGVPVLPLRPKLAADDTLAAAIALWLLRNDHAALDGGFHSLDPHALVEPATSIWGVRIHGRGAAIAARRQSEASMLRALGARPDVAASLLDLHGAHPAPRPSKRGVMPC